MLLRTVAHLLYTPVLRSHQSHTKYSDRVFNEPKTTISNPIIRKTGTSSTYTFPFSSATYSHHYVHLHSLQTQLKPTFRDLSPSLHSWRVSASSPVLHSPSSTPAPPKLLRTRLTSSGILGRNSRIMNFLKAQLLRFKPPFTVSAVTLLGRSKSIDTPWCNFVCNFLELSVKTF
ncbi:hypothetical protein K440DRAFT_620295 [Wilcoxina mikolae CBS 423.85]|nr:hypothetical protein K440DRAFT_620295 [Wilcoxina mikolae CBS 423.85]